MLTEKEANKRDSQLLYTICHTEKEAIELLRGLRGEAPMPVIKYP